MKRYLSIILSVIAIGYTSCDYNEENFPGLDDMSKPTNVAQYQYEITSADITTIANTLLARKNHNDSVIANRLKSDNMFSDVASASTLVPIILTSKYYSVDKGASANVTYSNKLDVSQYLLDLQAAPTYTLDNEDYQLAWGAESKTNYFTPSHSPEKSIPAILTADYPEANEGDVVIAQYQYADQEPTDAPVPIRLLDEDFETYLTDNAVIDRNGWTSFMEVGTKTWQSRYYASESNRYAQMSNGSSGEYSAWIISPAIDLSNTKSNTFSFDVNVGYWTASCLEVKISTDPIAATNPMGVAWTDVTSLFSIPTSPTSAYGTFASAGSMQLDSYSGTIYVAFRYTGSATSDPKKTTTYQIDNVKVEGIDKDASGGSGLAPTPYTLLDAYVYTSSAWKLYTNVIVLDPQDYKDMGVSTLSYATASVYLPKYLKLKYPYATEGSTMAIVYKNGNTTNGADEYEFHEDQWTPNAFVEQETNQFVFSDIGWVFDPTLYVTMVKGKNPTDDYMMVVLYVKDKYASETPTLINSYGDAEYYYGFNANYGNISIRESDRLRDPAFVALTTEEEKKAFLNQRTEEGLGIYLSLKYPNATPQVAGIDVFGIVTTAIYDGPSTISFTYKYQCVGANPSKWEFVEIVK